MNRISGYLILLCSILTAVGVRTFISPCRDKAESGMWMSCHWAGEAVFAAAVVLIILSVLAIIIKNTGIKRGIYLSLIPSSLLVAVLPGNVIGLCMMDTMRCHTLFRPGAFILGILTAFLSAAAFILYRKKE